MGGRRNNPRTYGIAKARSWLSECKEHHTSCNENIEEIRQMTESELPTHILDIGPLNCRSPRLIVTKDAGLNRRNCSYVTLSHRWGDSEAMPKTTEGTYKQHLKSIRWNYLSKMFQDAIFVTQSLGYRYLWIDSLCILQDSEDHKDIECSRMHMIYLNCDCMIAASDGTRQTGFLSWWDDVDNFNRSSSSSIIKRISRRLLKPWNRPQSVPSPLMESLQRSRAHLGGNNSVKGKNKTLTLGDLDSDLALILSVGNPHMLVHWTSTLNGQLSKRGWTLQEYQLAPRILHYTDKGLLWECRNSIGTGNHSELLDRRDINVDDESIELGTRYRILDRPVKSDSFTRWLLIVAEYTERSLTYEEDRLLAISGIASLFAYLTGQETNPEQPTYLAGLWREDLHRGLLWSPDLIETADSNIPRSDGLAEEFQNNLPSWSWACSKTRKMWADGTHYLSSTLVHGLESCQFRDTNIRPLAINRYGHIEGNWIELEGHYFEGMADLAVDSLHGRQYAYGDFHARLDFEPDLTTHCWRGEDSFHTPKTVRWLWLARANTRPKNDPFNLQCLVGLLLEKDQSQEGWKRIGIFWDNRSAVPHDATFGITRLV